MTATVRLSLAEAHSLAADALRAAGAGAEAADVLARATVEAEAAGNGAVGFAHLPDYLDALRAGRIDGAADPVVDSPAPAILRADARGGIAQLGFARARADLAARARSLGLALFLQRGGYTVGELGWYVRALAREGLVGLAACSGPALIRPPGATANVYCTNPIAFSVPGPDGPALLVDQSSSATAYVSLRAAAADGRTIPPGWAVDEAGRPTTDAAAALRGALLTFGGERGANVALMVEVLAAGLSGAAWAPDAPRFDTGERSPDAGLFVLALAPQLLGEGVAGRVEAHLRRLEALGVHRPGARKSEAARHAAAEGLELDAALVARLRRSG